MIGGLLLILLGIAGAMQAPVWAVPMVAVMIIFLCGGVPFWRTELTGSAAWAAVLVLSALAYGVGLGLGRVLIG